MVGDPEGMRPGCGDDGCELADEGRPGVPGATSDEPVVERVSFSSDGLTCAGMLYRPARFPGPIPGVVLANGFSNTMDWLLPDYARRFAAAGFAALTFDYRHLGLSEGTPRQLISTRLQRQDVRAAVRFARSHEAIDGSRIALWGTSLGGGHVFSVALDDPGISAVVVQVPGFDLVSRKAKGPAATGASAAWAWRVTYAAVVDAVRGRLGLSPRYLKVFGTDKDPAVFTDPALAPRFERLMANSRTWQNRITPRFFLAAPRYHRGQAERLRAPFLVCIADAEAYANRDFQEAVALAAPRGEIKHYPGDHFAFYHDLLDRVVTDQVTFLTQHLDRRDA